MRKLWSGVVLGTSAAIGIPSCTADLRDLDACRALAHAICQRQADCNAVQDVDSCIAARLGTTVDAGRSSSSNTATGAACGFSVGDKRQCLNDIAALACSASRQAVPSCGSQFGVATGGDSTPVGTDAGTSSDTGGRVNLPGCIAAPSGLVSWWTGDDTTKDSAGLNDGTFDGSVTYAAAMVGRGFSFDGKSSVSASTIGLPTGSSDRTIELWGLVSAPGASNEQHVFAQYGSLGIAGGTYSLFAYAQGSVLTFSQWGQSLSGGSIGVGTWHHLAVQSSGNVVSLFVDGQLVNSRTFDFNTPGGSRISIGGVGPAPDGQIERLIGMADEISVYSRALSAAEIQSIYTAGKSGKCRP